jgi:hypothetical protein
MSLRITHYLLAFCMSGSLWSQCSLNTFWITGSDGINCPPSGAGFPIANLGGTPPYTFSVPPSGYLLDGTYVWWSVLPGLYTGQIQVTDALGCQGVVNTYTLWVVPPNVTNIATLPSCIGQATGTVTYQVTSTDPRITNTLQLVNGSGQVVQSLNPLNGARVVSNLAAGNYIFRSTASYLGCTDTYDQPFTIASNVSNCDVRVSLRAALQGPLPSGTVMTDGLRSANLVPLSEPYSPWGYNYIGSPSGATIAPAMLAVTGDDAIVDWVVVELRNASTPSQVLASKAALIQRDGDIMATNGADFLDLPLPSGNYHVALRHRNHLGVMTQTALSLSATPIMVDFRSAATGCYGTTPRAQVGSVYCLWSGDGSGNGALNYTGSGNDRDLILSAIGGATPNSTMGPVYDRRDVNMDGVIKYTGANNDRDIILLNVGSTTPNAIRTQQLP